MFCDNLRAARKKAGFSQREIAEKLFVSAQAVGKWERGDATPGPDAIMQMASILNVSADELLDVQIKRGPAELHADKAQKAYDIIRSLPEDRQTEALRYLEYLEQQGKQ